MLQATKPATAGHSPGHTSAAIAGNSSGNGYTPPAVFCPASNGEQAPRKSKRNFSWRFATDFSGDGELAARRIVCGYKSGAVPGSFDATAAAAPGAAPAAYGGIAGIVRVRVAAAREAGS